MTLTYEQAVAAITGGDRLMITHPDPSKATDRTSYGLVVSGKNIGLRTYRKLAPDLIPVSDGLFGDDGASQTYTLPEGFSPA